MEPPRKKAFPLCFYQGTNVSTFLSSVLKLRDLTLLALTATPITATLFSFSMDTWDPPDLIPPITSHHCFKFNPRHVLLPNPTSPVTMIILSASGKTKFFIYFHLKTHTSSARMDLGNTWARPGYTGTPKDTKIINQMMLRFRPIAPKPVANSSGPGTTPETLLVGGKRRTKRKYVRVKKNDKCKINKKEKSDGSSDDHQTVVTLQLLPESSGGVKSLPENRSYPKTINFFVQDRSSIWINNNILSIGAPDPSDRTSVEIRSPVVMESWVTVDGLTNTTLVDLSALGSTDMEKMMNLQRDTCPGFISDGLDSVKWVNLAYRRMIDPVDDGGEPPEMAVRLVVKENKSAALLLLPSFACIVRIVYTWNKVKQSRTMPCDVWKMDFGGFAWKFDAKAALSLGR